MIDINAVIADLFDNPYSAYDKLRAVPPVFIECDANLNTKGIWLFSKYSDVKEVFDHSVSISKNIAATRGDGQASIFELNMLNMDGYEHIKNRNLVAKYFTKKVIQNLSSTINDVIDECLLDIASRPTFDLANDFAEIIPVKVVLKLLGLPLEDASMIRMWSLDMAPSFDSFQQQRSDLMEKRIKILTEISKYIRAQMRNINALPEGSFLKYLCSKHQLDEISEDQAVGAAILILFAGHETTISLIGNALYLLLNHPEQWGRVCNDKSLIPGAIEEVLRFESPVQRSSFRVAIKSVMVGGQRVEAGQQLSALIGAANRDGSFFENPDVFDIERNVIRNFSFGGGSHLCLGQMLARLEAKTALEKITKSLPNLRLKSNKALWRKNSFFRQLHTLSAIRV